MAAVITAAMIRCVPFVSWFRMLFCESCGEPVAHITESGDQLCGSCLVERRSAYRAQHRAATIEAARKPAQDRALARRKEAKARRDLEGTATAGELFRTGYFDELYGEWVPGECEGPRPRWIEEPTYRTTELRVSPNALRRTLLALRIAAQHPTLPIIRDAALQVASDEMAARYFVANGHRDVTTMYDGTDDRDLAPDVLAWLHRDPSAKAILSRWNRPDDELEFMEQLREEGRENEWWELMTEFRRRKLDTLLKEYFGLDDYRASMIVLKWEQTPRGWKPAKQMNAVDWVKWSCEQSGSILGGLQSCTRSLQTKIQLRKRAVAKQA